MKLEEINAMLDHGMAIYRHYIADNVPVKKKILSPFPFRNEHDPSFQLFPGKNGNVLFSDFGIPVSGNHWQFVMTYHEDCSFAEAVAIVRRDVLHQQDGSPVPRIAARTPFVVPEKVPVAIVPKYREWRNSDADLFSPYGISIGTMKKFRHRPVEKYLLDKGTAEQRWVIRETPTDPIYALEITAGSERFKMYRPLTENKRHKWVSNIRGDEDFFGLDLLPPEGDVLFWMAGNKDTESFYEQIGLPCISTNHEQANVDLRLLTDLRIRFRRHFTLYDDDPTGHKASTKLLHQYGFQPRNQPIIEGHRRYDPDNAKFDFSLLIRQLLPYPDELRALRSFFHSQ